jgi:histidyl-tRNA synthetase
MIRDALTAPPGAVQYDPAQAELLEGLARRLMAVLRTRGYRQMMVPVYEPFELYGALYGPEVRSRLVTFTTDREYALRPDLTAGICRTLAPSLTEPPASPVRVAAWGRAYRHERVRPLRRREFHQLGVERVGDSGPGADVEVLSLARAALLDAGLGGGLLRVGHSGLRLKLLARFGAKLSGWVDALSRLRDRLTPPRTGADLPHGGARVAAEDHEDLPSFVAELARDTGLALTPTGAIAVLEDQIAAALAELPADVRDGVLASTWAAASLDELADNIEAVWPDARAALHAELGHVEACVPELEPFVLRFSLGAGRWSGFYTGFTFEVDAPVLGPDVAQILGGGRYDKVMHALGAEGVGAAGFAMGLERLAAAVEMLHGPRAAHRRFGGQVPVLVAWATESDMGAAASRAELLAGVGCPVAYHTHALPMGTEGPDRAVLSSIAGLPGTPYRHVVAAHAGTTWVADLAMDTSFEADTDALRLMFDRRDR